MDTRRFYGLDALRGIMMLLGVVLHASFYYLIEAGIHGQVPSLLLLVITAFIHEFRMPLFFVLAGFFTALLVSRYGVRATFTNRARRILLPFLLGLVTVLPVTLWAVLSMIITGMNGEVTLISSMTDLDPVLREMEKNNLPARLSPLHLWFLYYLMIFYLFMPFCEGFLGMAARRGWESRIRGHLANPLVVLLLAAVTAVTLWPFKGASVLVNDRLFIPTPSALVYYLVFFLSGYVFFHYREVLGTFQKYTGTYCVAGLLMFVWAFIPGYMESRGSVSTAVHITAVVCNALSTWLLVFFFMGLFLKYFDSDTPLTRNLAQSAYWIYLVHMPLIFLAGLLMTDLALGYFLKFLILTCITSVVCYYTYTQFVRKSWVSVLLNGRRFSGDGTALVTPVMVKS